MMATGKKNVLLALLGLAVGTLNGLLGAGGGVLAVLGLRYALRGGQQGTRTALAGALFLTLPLSLLSLWRYARAGALPPLSDALHLALPALLGGALGAFLLPHLRTAALQRLFGLLTLLSGVLLILR